MNTEDNHPLRFDDIPEVLGWIKRKLVELDAKIDVIQGKKKLAVEEDRWFSVQEVSDYLPEHPAVQTYIRGQVQSASHTTKMASDYAF